MTRTTRSMHDIGARAACLQRLATALSGYHELDVTIRESGPALFLAARNRVSGLSETITVTQLGDRLAFLWSWGEPISDADDPDSAAEAIAYVLAACGARPGRES